MKNSADQNKVVFFDGVCHLCNGSVKFLLKYNSKKDLVFSPLQSDRAKEILDSQGKKDLGDSIIYLKNGRLLSESTAALHLAGELVFPINILKVFLIVPAFIRNGVYRWIARNRYSWFGKYDSCMIPEPEVSHRFLS